MNAIVVAIIPVVVVVVVAVHALAAFGPVVPIHPSMHPCNLRLPLCVEYARHARPAATS